MNRRAFLLLASGAALTGFDLFSRSETPYLRFAVASDGHYGEPGADFVKDYQSIVSSINDYHNINPIDFLMVNGDISHDAPDHLHEAKTHLDSLKMPYKVGKGNHDRMDEILWNELWGVPFDYSFSMHTDAFIALNTSDLAGTYLCPDYSILEKMLDQEQDKRNIFLFMHINPAAQTRFAVECDRLLTLIKAHRNVRAVFNGHDHDHENVIFHQNIPFVFDGHFGGTWGTLDKGYRMVECFEDGRIQTFMMDPKERKKEEKLS